MRLFRKKSVSYTSCLRRHRADIRPVELDGTDHWTNGKLCAATTVPLDAWSWQ